MRAAILGRLLAALLWFQAGPAGHVQAESGNLRAGQRETLLAILEQPHLEHRSCAFEMVRLCVDLLLRFQRRRTAAIHRNVPGEWKGRCASTSQGALFRAP